MPCALTCIQMNVGSYKGASALAAYEKWQETISQNLASVTVNGYRRNETSFAGVIGDVMKVKSGDSVIQTQNGVMPQAKRTLNMTPGSSTYTGIDTNFSAEGEGFFRVRLPSGEVGYTRNGNFRLNTEYNLSTQDGNIVEGDNGPITFRKEGGIVYINGEGLITQGDQQIGKLALFTFQKPEELRRAGGGLLAPEPGNLATPIERPAIMHRCIEASNVKPIEEMINLVSLGRAYESAKKVIDASDEAAGKAIQYLGGQG